MNQRIIQLPCNLETLFKMVGLPFFQFKGQRQTTSRPVLLFLLIVHECPSPFLCFSTPLYRIFRTFSSKNSKFDIHPLFFLLYSDFCICLLRPFIGHSIHPVPKTY